jgi:HAD superfamily hydrolase (TIGR01509 family)
MTPEEFQYDAVSFDVDGTVYSIDHFKVHVLLRSPLEINQWRSMERARRAMRAEGRLHEDIDAAIAAGMATDLGVSPDEAAAFAQKLVHEQWPRLLTKIKPYRGIRPVLEALAAAGITIIAASDYPPGAKLDALGLGDLPWAAVLDAGAFGALKPRPEIFQAIVDASGASPDRVLHVGDSAFLDVGGAQTVGMHTALVGDEAKKPSSWSAQPTWAFPTVNGFCKAVRAALAARSEP